MSFAEKLRGASPVPDLRVVGVSGDRLRHAMGLLGPGVSVVTTYDLDGRPVGTIADVVSSVSRRPPLVLACLVGESETLAALLVRRRFAINVLHSSQTELLERFARLPAEDIQHAVADHTIGDVPLLQAAIATLECDLHDLADGGDHSVVIGHVTGLA